MAIPSSNNLSFGGLAKRLVNDGLVDATVMQKALIESQKEQVSLISYLVKNKLAKSAQIAYLLADEFGDPLIDIDAVDIEQLPKEHIDEKIVRQYNLLPFFKRGKRLFTRHSRTPPTRWINTLWEE